VGAKRMGGRASTSEKDKKRTEAVCNLVGGEKGKKGDTAGIRCPKIKLVCKKRKWAAAGERK